ncbi:hypothetical protein BC940DRAFT_297274 [Gongronella butleri]|nr:hypothetical protein BC940DRAFT_297274 [Gongronella butleri]
MTLRHSQKILSIWPVVIILAVICLRVANSCFHYAFPKAGRCTRGKNTLKSTLGLPSALPGGQMK